jgi:hypothetical protein
MTVDLEWGIGPGSGIPGDAPEIPAVSLDVYARIKKRLLTQFRDKPQIDAWITWLSEQLQEMEGIVHNVRWYTLLANGFGKQLDLHGVGLGLKREELDDDDYRTALIVRFVSLFVRRSPALARNIMGVLTAGTDTTYSYQEHYPAAYEISLREITAEVAAWWESLLRTAKPEGVRFTVKVSEVEATAFRFDTEGAGYDQGNAFAYTLES